MGKKTIIMLIILLVIVVAVITTFLVLYLNGTISFKDGFHFGKKIETDTIIYEEKYKMDEINSIDVKRKAGNIIFENSNDDNIKVEIYGEKKSDAEVSLVNNELKIEYKAEGKGGWIFGLGRAAGDVIIYIPAAYEKNIKIVNDAGEVKIANAENADIDVDCDAGNVKIDRIKNARIKCDAGDIEIKNLLNRCNIKVDAGNLKIDHAQLNENSSIKADSGNVRIKELNNIYIDTKVDMGNCNISNNNKESEVTLKIDCNMGNVTVKDNSKEF